MSRKEVRTRILIGISLTLFLVIIYFIGRIPKKQIEDDINRVRSEIKKRTKERTLQNTDSQTSKHRPQVNCVEFKNGYKKVLWNWNKSNVIDYFQSQGFHIEDESIYDISDGRSAISFHFRKGRYDYYRSKRQMRERSINFVNKAIFQIEFLNYFNWNYNFQMAYDAAKEVADKYNLPKRSDQTVGFGARNIVWYDDCPDFRVIVRLFWDPNVIDGESNRYLAINIFNVEKANEFKRIQDIYRIEKRKKRTRNFSKEL